MWKLIVVVLLLTGCASSLTPEQRDQRRAYVRQLMMYRMVMGPQYYPPAYVARPPQFDMLNHGASGPFPMLNDANQ